MIWNISPDETNEKIISYAKTNDWMFASGKTGVKPVNTWQKDFTKIVVDYVDNFYTCIDVGSHYGFLTKEFSFYFDNVYAFEMNKKIYNYFLKNINDCDNVKSYNVALYNKESNDLFSTDNLDSGQNMLSEKGSVKVKTKTLDSYKLKNVGLIKLDIQGGEFQALEGSVETLKNNDPILVVEVLNKKTYSEYLKNKKTIEFMFSLNYKIVNNLHNDIIFKKNV